MSASFAELRKQHFDTRGEPLSQQAVEDFQFDDRMIGRDQQPAIRIEWLKPIGGEWDAALDSSTVTPSAMPAAAEIDTRKSAPTAVSTSGHVSDEAFAGSNNWAVGGALTADGAAILADDMHLGLGVPNIWFRAQLVIGEGGKTRRIAGVTLPGVPSVVVGSNGNVAWGFTNSYGQWFDWVALQKSANKTPITTHRESIAVKGNGNVDIEVREAPWGPILRADAANDYALAWTLYRDGAVNFRANDIASAASADDAIAIAQQSGIPHQNFVVADKAGNIAWTTMGRIPLRDSPASASNRGRLTPEAALPPTWLPPAQYPLIKNPADGRLWTRDGRMAGVAGGLGFSDGVSDRVARPQVDEGVDAAGIRLSRQVDRVAEVVSPGQGDRHPGDHFLVEIDLAVIVEVLPD